MPGGIAHAFNGSAQQAQAFVELGLRLGFGLGAQGLDSLDQGLLFLDRDHSHALVGFAHGNTTRRTAIDHQQCLASKNACQCHGRLCLSRPGAQCGQQQRYGVRAGVVQHVSISGQ